MSQPKYDFISVLTTFCTVIENAHVWAQEIWSETTYDENEETAPMDVITSLQLGATHACGTSYCFAGFHATRRGLVTAGLINSTARRLGLDLDALDLGHVDGAFALTNTEPSEGDPAIAIGHRETIGGYDIVVFSESVLRIAAKVIDALPGLDANMPVYLTVLPKWVSRDLGVPDGSAMFNSSNSLLDLLFNLLIDATSAPTFLADENPSRDEYGQPLDERTLEDLVHKVGHDPVVADLVRYVVPPLLESTRYALDWHAEASEQTRWQLSLDSVDASLCAFASQLETLAEAVGAPTVQPVIEPEPVLEDIPAGQH